jgi:hypothetical protein
VSDTARERAVVWHVRKEDVHKGSARDVDPPFASFDVVLYRDYEALLAEREALRTELHFSETMHQADLDERVKIEKDCRALRERVAALEEGLREMAASYGVECSYAHGVECRGNNKMREKARKLLAGVPVAEEAEKT